MITTETQISQSVDTTLTKSDCRSVIKELYNSVDKRQFRVRTSKNFDSLELTSRGMQICVDVTDDGITTSITIPSHRECFIQHTADSTYELSNTRQLVKQTIGYIITNTLHNS